MIEISNNFTSVLLQECGGDLVYRNCHPMCGACNSKGPCREACIKGCGCPREGTNQLLRLSTDSQTCVKKEECPGKMQYLGYQVRNKDMFILVSIIYPIGILINEFYAVKYSS